MNKLTNPELAVLGLVAEEPQHAYGIEQRVAVRGMREWTEIGFSSIYYVVKKLEKAGLLESDLSEVGGGPARRVYRLTESGGQTLSAEIRERLACPRPRSGDFLLGLANLPVLTPGEALSALEEHRLGLETTLEALHTKASADIRSNAPGHVRLVFEYSLAAVQAELDWVKKTIQNLGDEHERET